MYQRLLLILSVLFIAGTTMAQDVMTPTDGYYQYNPTDPSGSLTNPIPAGPSVMQKWVYDSTQYPNSHRFDGFPTLTQSNFKCYRWGNMAFRLRFPNGYNPSNKYPLMVFLHGAGEAASIAKNPGYINHENRDQLFWGAKYFEDLINIGEWNGFLLFPQIFSDGAEWDVNTITPINGILDKLEQYNGLDPDRVIAMGLSAGGYGTLEYANLYPKRIAATVTSCPEQVQDFNDVLDNFLQIPVWLAAGGIDTRPDPLNIVTTRDQFNAKGGNMQLSYYPTLPHQVWDTQWNRTDIYNRLILPAFWNKAHKAQPLVYYQNNLYCAGQPISTKLGITDLFSAYEWQRDNGGGFTTIPGATANTYTATQVGQYRVHFKRTPTSAWSDWTPNPIVISTKPCNTDTAFAEHFETSPVNAYIAIGGGPVPYTNSPYVQNNTTCQNGIFTNATQVFSQDGAGRFGGKFMLNNTTVSASNCPYFAGDQVWRTYNPATVTFNTDYTLNFYMGNQSTGSSNPLTPVAQLVPKINGVALSPTGVQAVTAGNTSWKKYSFTWNSGGANTAEIAITNNTTDGTGNDFVLDEISLVKYKAPAMPGAALKNFNLWAKGNSVSGYDGSPVAVWPNSDINGNALVQTLNTSQPLYKPNAPDNINFNPVVSYNPATNKYMFVPGGFEGGTSHNAVYAYIVTKPNNVSQNSVLLREGPTGGKLVMAQTTGSVMEWAGGEDSATIIATPSGSIDLKPTIWTFSKNTVATPSGNKTDIRKNGLVLASSNTANPFTGSASENFYINAFKYNTNTYLGSYDGSIAEVIYVLDSNLTAVRQNNIESYLAIKYGTTLGSAATPVSYTASDSTTVFWAGNATYQNDVFGIGTDSASGLVQTKSNSVNSGSGDGTGQSAKGNLVLGTNSTLLNKRFLMIGNDAANLNQVVIGAGDALPIAVGSTRVNREWKVINTGAVGAVDLSFDTTGLNNQAGGSVVKNYALMIDNDGDGNFNNNTISFFTATSASGKKINFSGVTLNNGVVFTILTLKNAALLPAIWLGFTAEAVNGNALLNWKTSDEINVDHYVVEHSYNGVSFTAIGSVAANNSSGVNKYTFTDNGLAPGIHYYRIRRIDKDGKGEYSDTKTVKITTTGANVQVRPNPVTGSTLILAVTVQQSSKTIVQVMSVDGKIMLQQKINLSAGNNLVNLDIAVVPSGIYLVQVQLSDEVVTKKFIRQH